GIRVVDQAVAGARDGLGKSLVFAHKHVGGEGALLPGGLLDSGVDVGKKDSTNGGAARAWPGGGVGGGAGRIGLLEEEGFDRAEAGRRQLAAKGGRYAWVAQMAGEASQPERAGGHGVL